ncbi:MAG: AAA family ATPase [Deltaproteobacteria bacterium]|nr:AAA family ATPase [Deltaproteobacteria bacterium]
MLAARRAGAQHLPGSSVLRSVIAPATTEDFDRWPPERRDRARAEAIVRLRRHRDSCPGELLVDGHFSLRERGTGRLHRVFTPEDIEFYDALVLIDASAAQVLAWRASDPRTRPVESSAEIDEHRHFERAQGVAIAAEMSITLLIVEDIALEDRVSKINHFLTTRGQP